VNRSGQMRRCGKRYGTEDAARRSKRAQAPGAEIARCAYGCPGWHVKPPAARRKPLPQVSRKRAREIRVRRAMLQALFPDLALCEVPFCNEVATDPHEPLTRARGGSVVDPDNVKRICRGHHREIHETEPDWAYDLGFLKHSWSEEGAA
jgi:hypothetical protein